MYRCFGVCLHSCNCWCWFGRIVLSLCIILFAMRIEVVRGKTCIFYSYGDDAQYYRLEQTCNVDRIVCMLESESSCLRHWHNLETYFVEFLFFLMVDARDQDFGFSPEAVYGKFVLEPEPNRSFWRCRWHNDCTAHRCFIKNIFGVGGESMIFSGSDET